MPAPELRHPLGDYLLITTKRIAFNRQAPYWLDADRLRTLDNERRRWHNMNYAAPSLPTNWGRTGGCYHGAL